MRTKRSYRLAVAFVALTPLLAGCAENIEKIDGGGVMLEVSDFGTLPVLHSLTSPGAEGSLLQIDSITLRNLPKIQGGATSPLMDIRMETYEVTYRRRDRGTRVPRALLTSIFGTVPVNGSEEYVNLPMLAPDQLLSDPFRDLALDGVDSETGSAIIDMDIQLRFFGRTLSGDTVASTAVAFTVKFTQ